MSDLAAISALAPVVLLSAAIVTMAAAGLQGTIGFGFSIVSVPILSLLDPSLAPVPQLLLSIPLSMVVFMRERADADWRGAAWIVVGLLPGVALGTSLLAVASGRWLDLAIAAVVAFAVLVIALGARVQRTTATKLGAGLLSGSFNVLSSIGGPPLALLYHGQRGPTVRATLAAVFLVGTTISIGARGIAGALSVHDAAVALLLLPALGIGLLLGRTLSRRVDGRPLRILTLVFAAIAAAGLVVRAVLA